MEPFLEEKADLFKQRTSYRNRLMVVKERKDK
jgi:hypothetical protein